MTKRGSSFGMRVVLYLGGELAQDIFVRGSVYIFFFRDVVSILCLFLFSLFSYSILLYTGLVTIYLWHTLYLFLIYIYIYDVCWFSTISPYVVSFLSLYRCFFMYAILYFCFTLRCLDEFCLKCFRKTGCENLSCHEIFSCKVFQEFMLGLDFIVYNK